ncbi:MAG: hypothetical protein ACR2PZ_19625 [Pseudomonadales bacterium]
MLRSVSILAILLLQSCTNATPRPSSSAYAQDVAGGFTVSEGYFTYGITIELAETITLPVAVRVNYENPADAASPMVQVFTHQTGRNLVVTSPPVVDLKYRQVYTVTFTFNDDPSKVHTTKVQYNLPPELERQMLEQSGST